MNLHPHLYWSNKRQIAFESLKHTRRKKALKEFVAAWINETNARLTNLPDKR